MPSLKDVRLKIAGVGKTKQITKAMYMVASAKLRGAQTRIERFRPYAEKYRDVLSDVAAKADGATHPLFMQRAKKEVSVVVLVTSDRGLCGGFNAMLIANALDFATRRTREGTVVKFICVGKKGRDAIRKGGYEILASYTDLGIVDFSVASGIGKTLVSGYTNQTMDEVVVIYGRFLSVARQVATVLPILPVLPTTSDSNDEKPQATESGEKKAGEDYIYEPHISRLLAELLPRFVNVQIYRALLDTAASENAARMSAMDNATRNCDEMASALTLLYNKTRQAAITNELIDIVGGAEALR